MLKPAIEVGRVVRSKAGRDAGRLFIVISELGEEYVLTADGKLRGIEKPKKKKRRHIAATPVIIEDAARRLSAGERIENHEIRKWLSNEEG